MDEIIKAVRENIPPLNDYLLRGFTNSEINNSISFIDLSFKEAVKLIGNAIVYNGYRVLPPEERVVYELNAKGKNPKLVIPSSELQLVEFIFTHDNNKHSTYLYTPYMVGDMLVNKNKKYAIIRGIAEQVFSRVQDTNVDGVMVRTIRAPILFNRKHSFRLISAKTGMLVKTESVVSVKLHFKPHPKRKCETTVIHYLLCKYGFAHVLDLFGLTSHDVRFVEHVQCLDDDHDYFVAQKVDNKTTQPRLFLQVRNSVLEHDIHRKLVAGILYITKEFNKYRIDDLIEPTGSTWRIMLGKIIKPSDTDLMARSAMDTHIVSVDHFIDPKSRDRFRAFDVNVSNIYEMLYYVFNKIDEIVVNSTVQDLYQMRIDIADGIHIPAFAAAIFRKFYHTNQRTVLRPQEVVNLLRIPRDAITKAYNASGGKGKKDVKYVNMAPQFYNDNWLLAAGIYKLRQAGSAEQRFHPSMAMVESIGSFSGNNVGQTGLINPMLQIDQNGKILKMPWSEDIDEIMHYLPQD